MTDVEIGRLEIGTTGTNSNVKFQVWELIRMPLVIWSLLLLVSVQRRFSKKGVFKKPYRYIKIPLVYE